MRRLLFVDDEVPILRALERMLRSHRRDWECQFVDDPVRALDVVESFQPDAVVSDMLMPGLDGAEFLTEAARRRPHMARFILSGEVGAGSLVRMARAAHQCLAKPCRGDVLVDVLRRALLDPEAVREPAILSGLYAIRSLPVPAPAFEAVRRTVGAPSSDARDHDAVELIAATVGLATKLLQVATWTRLGMGAPPLHVHDAYFQLGAPAICALLDSDLLKPVPGSGTTAFQRAIWRRSARASAAARVLAAAEGLDTDAARQVALVTLWSTAAPLLPDLCARDRYAALRQEADASGRPLALLEQERFGLSAVALCAQMLRLWGLSAALADRVAATAAIDDETSALDLLPHAAAAVADLLDGLAPSPAVLAALARRGLDSRVPHWRALATGVLDPVAA
ncbi:MAG: response regulator [Vicinamibacterales bacterium]